MLKSLLIPEYHTHIWMHICHGVESTQWYRKSLYAVALQFIYTGTKGDNSVSAWQYT